jgi:hypothetical protein
MDYSDWTLAHKFLANLALIGQLQIDLLTPISGLITLKRKANSLEMFALNILSPSLLLSPSFLLT